MLDFPSRIANSGLEPGTRIVPQVLWPLSTLPLLLVVQLIAPSPIWVSLTCAWASLYVFSYFWLRLQVPRLSIKRRAVTQVLLVGDELEVESFFANASFVPVTWCKVVDGVTEIERVASDRIVACMAMSQTDWVEKHKCQRRGRLQLGPTVLVLGDPIGLFQATRKFTESSQILVHPRVIILPDTPSPKKSLRGNVQRRRRLRADAKAPYIRQYDPIDSRRLIHWPSTAHFGELMVAEMESEPGARLTVVLNLNGQDHVGNGAKGTLEFSISVAGSLVAQTVNSSDQRQCGLLCAENPAKVSSLAPGQGAGHLWSALRILAGVKEGDFPLTRLLARSHVLASSQQQDSLLLVTPHPGAYVQGNSDVNIREHRCLETLEWLAELNSLRQRGLECGIILICHPSQKICPLSSEVDALLASFPQTQFDTDGSYTPLITHRRQRRIFLSTPFGGVREVRVEEFVG